ncbi:hypothetical protein [Sphaerospermopsis sp. FACHB-1194]|uniref:hypothetical protein n=1 Tax=Sphaerospermopsis sp. FACHB-1194 TaxID=2692862 RepID=UPI0016804D36|nr:hypothetical protein [Sphaerospermopsis sp. FACHB-1194]MBD2148354.1 hypothetical protein [Sphaerospermopsis sp. FACHB-1194]
MPRSACQEKKTAFALWANGHSLKYVRKQLNGIITDKTIYRWFTEFKHENPDYRERLDDYDIELSSNKIIENHSDWLERAIKTSEEIAAQNREIRLKLQDKLLIELDKEYNEINFKNVGILVSSLCNIQKNEFIVNGLHLLDVNRAVSILDSQGYEVSEKS